MMSGRKVLYRAALLAALAISISPARSGLAEVQRVLALPAEFASYRAWKPLMNAPQEVPLDLWMKCVAPSQADWDEARKAHGPHTQRMIQVFANPAAHKSLKNVKSKGFAEGSVLAKEKMTEDSDHTEFSGVAFMVKRSADQFPDSGGWEFRYFPSNDNEREQTQLACAGCHKTAARDFVFGDYPQK